MNAYEIPLCPKCSSPMVLKQVKNPKGWDGLTREYWAGDQGGSPNGQAPPYMMMWVCEGTGLNPKTKNYLEHEPLPEEAGYPEGWEFDKKNFPRKYEPLEKFA